MPIEAKCTHRISFATLRMRQVQVQVRKYMWLWCVVSTACLWKKMVQVYGAVLTMEIVNYSTISMFWLTNVQFFATVFDVIFKII